MFDEYWKGHWTKRRCLHLVLVFFTPHIISSSCGSRVGYQFVFEAILKYKIIIRLFLLQQQNKVKSLKTITHGPVPCDWIVFLRLHAYKCRKSGIWPVGASKILHVKFLLNNQIIWEFDSQKISSHLGLELLQSADLRYQHPPKTTTFEKSLIFAYFETYSCFHEKNITKRHTPVSDISDW